jgi:serine/threonine protein kinase
MRHSLRALEIILGVPFDHKVDIWAFGCVIWHFSFGCPIFDSLGWTGFYDEEARQDEYRLQMTRALGPFPEALLMKWPRRFKYFDTNGTLLGTWLEADPFPDESETFPPLDKVLEIVNLPGMEDKDRGRS